MPYHCEFGEKAIAVMYHLQVQAGFLFIYLEGAFTRELYLPVLSSGKEHFKTQFN